MAGHSKFKNIQYRKGAQDKKRAKQFAKIGREIQIAVKIGGTDPESNPRLRLAINNARSVNMPKDNVDRAINKNNNDTTDYTEVRYEGYGPYGTAFIVEALTDNKNRTASEIRSIFSKNGGNLGETGSVSFNFDKVGEIQIQGNLDDSILEQLLSESQRQARWLVQLFRTTMSCRPARSSQPHQADHSTPGPDLRQAPRQRCRD